MRLRVLTDSEQFSHFLQHAEWLRKYLQSRIPPWHEGAVSAEDLLQETWQSCAQATRDSVPNGGDELRNWLAAIARRKLFDRLKEVNSVKRGPGRTVARHRRGLESSLLDLFNTVSSPGRTPSAELSSKEAIRALRTALALLPENRREAIVMYYIEGKCRREIAECTGKSITAVGSLLAEGRSQLRLILGSASKFFYVPRRQVAGADEGSG